MLEQEAGRSNHDKTVSTRLDTRVNDVVMCLGSKRLVVRQRGYEMFDEIVNECLYESCLNYRALIGSYRDPIKAILMRTVEAWADRYNRPERY